MKRQNQTILIAEDDPNDQMLLKRAFKKINVPDTIHIVQNGMEAIAYLNGEGKYANRQEYEFPSFVITDLKMPLVNGFAVLQHLQGRAEWQIIPIIVLTASADTDDIKKAYLAGAKSFFIKPTTQSDLQSLLKKLHDYWIAVEVPQTDPTGQLKQTESEGKLGATVTER